MDAERFLKKAIAQEAMARAEVTDEGVRAEIESISDSFTRGNALLFWKTLRRLNDLTDWKSSEYPYKLPTNDFQKKLLVKAGNSLYRDLISSDFGKLAKNILILVDREVDIRDNAA